MNDKKEKKCTTKYNKILILLIIISFVMLIFFSKYNIHENEADLSIDKVIFSVNGNYLDFAKSEKLPFYTDTGEIMFPVRYALEVFRYAEPIVQNQKELLTKDYLEANTLFSLFGYNMEWNDIVGRYDVTKKHFVINDKCVLPNNDIIYYRNCEVANMNYCIYIPYQTEKNKDVNCILTTINTDILANEKEKYENIISRMQEKEFEMFDDFSPVFIIPILTNDITGKSNIEALSSQSIIPSDVNALPVHEKVHIIIEEAFNILNSEKYKTEKDKIIAYGFSNAGYFANRYSALYPEDVSLVVAGGLCNQIVLPLEELNNICLPYPIGLFGIENKADDYAQIPQFIFQGAEDSNIPFFYQSSFLENEINSFFSIHRIENENIDVKIIYESMENIVNDFLENVEYNLYENTEHKVTEEIQEDIKKFLAKKLKKGE